MLLANSHRASNNSNKKEPKQILGPKLCKEVFDLVDGRKKVESFSSFLSFNKPKEECMGPF